MRSVIKQKHYGKIEVNGSENDIVEIWNYQIGSDVIQIERKNLPKLIELLQAEVAHPHLIAREREGKK